MSSSVHPPDPVPARPGPRSLWSARLAAAPRGLSLAREAGSLLAWDESGSVSLLSRIGELQGRSRVAQGAVAACQADDGSACAAIGPRGEVVWLKPDLTARWERAVPARGVTCAMDPFGHVLAVSDAGAGLHLFDRTGKLIWHTQTPRPLVHLAFVPEQPRLVGCADFGLVACFDPAGACVWRDGLVSHIGGLAVSGDGSRIVLACFSDGLRAYNLGGKRTDRFTVMEPCRLVDVSYDARRILAGALGPRLVLVDRDGQTLATPALDAPPVALALAALGDTAFVGLADGRVQALALGG